MRVKITKRGGQRDFLGVRELVFVVLGLVLLLSVGSMYSLVVQLWERIDRLERAVSILEVSVLKTTPAPSGGTKESQTQYLAAYIARMEGYFVEGSLPQRQNNPGALVFVGQRGATLGENGYAHFGNPTLGWEALERDLTAKIGREFDLGKAWPYLAGR